MSLRDLFAANAALLRDQEQGYGEEVTYFAPNPVPGQPSIATIITAIVSMTTLDALQHVVEGDEQYETAELEVSADFTIDPHGWFTMRGESSIWKYVGLGGRDLNLKTILVSRPMPVSHRMARRRS
jgi:hypothetical protein